MSRCFPFPPPGYEKNIRTEEADPLIKEKYKEKKHKKDKDKEQKEGKEKKSKDRSKDQHKETKEKKEKHKERKDKEKDNEKSKPLEEKKVQTNPGHRDKLVINSVQNNSSGESKYVEDLATRIRYEEEATGSQSVQKINYPNQRSFEITGKAFEKSSFCPIQVTNHREDDDKRINTQKNFAEAKGSENAVARGLFGADQKRVEVMGKPMENREQARQMESPEKIHHKESMTKSDKARDKEGIKKNDRNKEKKESINKTHQEKPKLIGGPKLEEREKESVDIKNCKPPDLSRASTKNLIGEGNLGKRKDVETNGFLYENGTTPKKLERYSASVSSVENGRRLAPPKPASEVQGTMCKPEFKEVKNNSFVEKEKLCPPTPLAAKMKENGEASRKPPHPDLKYLNQILNVPKRKLLVEVNDDQEWLFCELGVKLKKARRDSPDSGGSLQVWNQAFRIESADIAALPYVVPF